MELTEVQLWLIGMIAMVIIWLINFWRKQGGASIPSGWLTAGVYVVSFLLALAFGLPAIPIFPPFDGPVTFVTALFDWINTFFVNVGPIVALATLIYNALLKQVLDGLGERVVKAKG